MQKITRSSLCYGALGLSALCTLWACDGRMQQIDRATGAPVGMVDGQPPGDKQEPMQPGEIVRPPDEENPAPQVDVCKTINPGEAPLHRLTRVEYQNSVAAIFPGLNVQLSEQSLDEKIGPFNANTSVAVSRNGAEQYLTNAELIAQAVTDDLARVIPCASLKDQTIGKIEAESLQGTAGQGQSSSWLLWSNGHVETNVDVTRGADHDIAIRAWGSRAGADLPKMRVSIDGQEVQTFDVDALSDSPKIYTTRLRLEPGTHTIQVAFTNDFNDAANNQDRNLWVDYIELTASGLVDGDAACAKGFIADFGKRTWRRPLSDGEQRRFEGLFGAIAAEQGFVEGVRAVIEAGLQSPHFIYRVEPGQEGSESVVPLTGYELASRLSYYLWDGPPDDELLRAAEAGELNSRAGLEAQTKRLLQDPRARESVNSAFLQLLGLSDFTSLDKAPAELRQPMYDEALAFIDHVIWEGDGKLSTLLTADFAFVSPETAAIYGVDAPASGQLERVELGDKPRAGVLTLPAVLARYGYGQRPVHRGLFLRETFLCARPAPPPDELINPPETYEGQSMRSQAQGRLMHNGCGGCHAQMDPLGLAFDQFDATGRWVDQDEWGNEVNSQGGIKLTLSTNGDVSSPTELAQLLAGSDEVKSCFSKQWLRYALGRDTGTSDACSLTTMEQAMQQLNSDSVLDLFVAITTTDAFRYRRAYSPDAQ